MAITVQEIKVILKSEVSNLVDVASMTEDTSWDSSGVDSLDKTSFFFAIEEKYSVEVSDNTVESIDTIKDLIKFLEK